jgi:hypothetical protein
MDKTMKLIYYSFMMAFIITAIARSQPKLFIDKHKIDLGTMYIGEKRIGKIIIKNIGNDTLRILYVGSSCGCTTIKRTKDFLLPGQSDYIKYEFRPEGIPGPVEKDINILTNDSTSKIVDVKIIAETRAVLQSIPGYNTSNIIENAVIQKPVTKRIVMKNVSGLPIIIRGNSVSSPSITVQMDKKNLQPNDTLNVDVTILPKKLGLSNETLYIITNHKVVPRVEVKFTIFGTQGK